MILIRYHKWFQSLLLFQLFFQLIDIICVHWNRNVMFMKVSSFAAPQRQLAVLPKLNISPKWYLYFGVVMIKCAFIEYAKWIGVWFCLRLTPIQPLLETELPQHRTIWNQHRHSIYTQWPPKSENKGMQSMQTWRQNKTQCSAIIMRLIFSQIITNYIP